MDMNSSLPEHGGSVTDDNTEPVTCLSVENHDRNIRDFVTHYFGCIEIHERKSFFTDENQVWEFEEARMKELGGKYLQASGDRTAEAQQRVKDLRQKAKTSVESHNTRTKLLRNEISKKLIGKKEEGGNLVEYVTQSHKAWVSSQVFEEGIQKVKKWRDLQKKPTGVADGSMEGDESSSYSLEEDVNAYIIQYEVRETTEDTGVVTQSLAGSSTQSTTDDESTHSKARPRLNGGNVRLSLEGITDERLKPLTFPDQRLRIVRLIEKDTTNESAKMSMSRTQNGTRIRYFHFPSNNMRVSFPNGPVAIVKLGKETNSKRFQQWAEVCDVPVH